MYLLPRIVPPLEEGFVSPVKLVGAWQAGGAAPGAEIEPGLTEFLDAEPLNSLDSAQIAELESKLFGPEPCILELSPDRGLALYPLFLAIHVSSDVACRYALGDA